MDNHVRFEGLLLDEGLEADVALEGPHTGVDQHVSLQVGRQSELSGADVTLEFFHTLEKHKVFGWFNLVKYMVWRTIGVSRRGRKTQTSSFGL